jgi:TPR repeat protein
MGLSGCATANETKGKAPTAELHEQACTGGAADGCYDLGVMYATGEGVGKDAARAAALYDQACTGGEALFGCHNLGSLYDHGEGVPKDSVLAKRYFGKACDMGRTESCQYR